MRFDVYMAIVYEENIVGNKEKRFKYNAVNLPKYVSASRSYVAVFRLIEREIHSFSSKMPQKYSPIPLPAQSSSSDVYCSSRRLLFSKFIELQMPYSSFMGFGVPDGRSFEKGYAFKGTVVLLANLKSGMFGRS